MKTKITATELARNLSDILNRVRYRGESFIVERSGEVIAELKPSPARRAFTVGDFVEFWKTVPKPDPEFWNDVEQAHREMNQPLPEPSAWDC
jgi:antitoxin (DNA-binding transcriptional repressor) of toxin-antitoxin stability system